MTREDGLTEFVFLLDEQLEISGVGLISMNMAEQMVSNITEMSYRETAEKITDITGQRISAMGVWNVIQALGEKVCEDEQKLVKAHKAGQLKGDKEAPVLFEETDGVYIRLQREKQNKGEIKVGIAYDGWKETRKGRYALDSKVVVAGFSNSKEFQEYREAAIAETYNLDETEVRIMNADGAEWVKNICDADTVFQLDPFHRNKAIKENIPYPNSITAIHELLDTQELDRLFEYLEIYKNSLDDEEEIEKAERLITYFRNNREGLIPYSEKGLKLPENKEGLIYRNIGTMENHVWSVIAKRMKHNHTSWSIKGGNNLAKILAKKCSGRLNEPMYDFFHRKLLKRRFLMMDETPVQVLNEEDRRAQTKSYFWVIRTGEDGLNPIILYNYTPTRAGENAKRFLKGIEPGFYLMADGYQGYNKVKETNRCCCWAHIRRYLLESIPKGMDKDYTNPAVQGFLYCEKLFAYERSYREKGLSHKQIYNRRLKDEKPVIEDFLSWLNQVNPGSNGKLKKAITYIKNREAFLMTYLEDGRCSFSNNLSENSIRPVTVGRKNWLLGMKV